MFLTQAIFDLRALHEARAEGHDETAARLTNRSRRDLVSLLAADMYSRYWPRTRGLSRRVLQRETAQALFSQAQDLRQSGIVAGIEVLRAQVRLSSESQRVTVADNDAQKMKLQLARMIGLPLGQEFTLSDQFPNVTVPEITLQQALDRAYMQRPDFLSAIERVRAAEASRRAALGAGPSCGPRHCRLREIGLSPSTAVPTYTLVGSVTVPLFQGGRTQGRLIEADADLRQPARGGRRHAARSIYYDVRTAFLDLQATEEQLQTATQSRELASQQLDAVARSLRRRRRQQH